MGYPGRQNIYEATIRRMVLQSFEIQEEQFRREHEGDTDQQLLVYLRENAIRLNHTPWPEEILGGSYIEARFGSWGKAVTQANLPYPEIANQHKNFLRYHQEVERQKVVYHQRKVAKKILAQKRRTQQAARKKNRA